MSATCERSAYISNNSVQCTYTIVLVHFNNHSFVIK